MVWNSFRSTFSEPSNRSDAVIDETTIHARLANRRKTAKIGKGNGSKLTLGNQTVEILVVRALKAKVAAADVIDGLVVDHEGAISVLKSGVGGQDRVVWLDDGGGGLRSGIDAELQLALLPIVNGEALHQQRTETRTGTASEGVEDEEALQTAAVVGDTSDLVQDLVDQLLADGVVSPSVVVGRILLSGDQVFRVEQAAVGAGPDLVDDVRFEVAVDGAWDIFSLACRYSIRVSCCHI